MFEYYFNVIKAAKHFDKPDVIIGSSAHPLASYAAIKLAKKYRCKSIVEIRDLWPESIVEYTSFSKNNPIIKLLYSFEKKLYERADEVIFVAEGLYDYILEKGWQDSIPKDKIHCISNGIDLEDFENNKKIFIVHDADLANQDLFKVIYTGSIRRVNNLGLLLDIAKKVTNKKVLFLIWGDGDEKEYLQQRAESECIKNLVFKGKVDKAYIPGIVSRADLNFAHNNPSSLFRFGISFNKIFDYLASGKPILCDFPSKYNPVVKHKAGIEVDNWRIEEIAKVIDEFASMETCRYLELCDNAKKAASQYNFKYLTEKLIRVIENE